jgi:hypothetical protein
MATTKRSTNGAARKMILRAWSKSDHSELKKHSKAKTPVVKISRAMKRTAGALRQKALKLGLPLGHRR